ncbi:MAG: AAA family ATPase [Bacillota bacterium]
MEDVKKVVVIEQQDNIHKQLSSMLNELGITSPEIVWLSNHGLDQSREMEADCIIIDGALVESIKNTISEIRKYNSKKLIFMFDTLNNPRAHTAIMLGADVYFKGSGITGLIYKMYGTFQPHKAIHETQSYEQIKHNKKGKIIAVNSAKGGTGKTTIAINMAFQYSSKGLRVLLVDMAMYGNVGINMKIVHRGTGLSSIITALEQTGESIKNTGLNSIIKDNIYTYNSENIQIDVIIAATPLKMEKMAASEIEMIMNSLRELDYDVIILDTSSDLSKRNLAVVELADHVILVAAPELASGWNLLQYKEILQSIGVKDKCSLVVNRYSKNTGFFSRELEMELSCPLICEVPELNDLILWSNQGQAAGHQKKHWINTFYRRIAHQFMPIFTKKEIGIVKAGIFKK